MGSPTEKWNIVAFLTLVCAALMVPEVRDFLRLREIYSIPFNGVVSDAKNEVPTKAAAKTEGSLGVKPERDSSDGAGSRKQTLSDEVNQVRKTSSPKSDLPHDGLPIEVPHGDASVEPIPHTNGATLEVGRSKSIPADSAPDSEFIKSVDRLEFRLTECLLQADTLVCNLIVINNSKNRKIELQQTEAADDFGNRYSPSAVQIADEVHPFGFYAPVVSGVPTPVKLVFSHVTPNATELTSLKFTCFVYTEPNTFDVEFRDISLRPGAFLLNNPPGE